MNEQYGDKWDRTFNSLSRDHISLENLLERLKAYETFNSLSRDHLNIFDNAYLAVVKLSTPSLGITRRIIRGGLLPGRDSFQLPLSGSLIIQNDTS